ncbi:MAG: response regulator, partial [Chloroflexi bacterium]
MQKILVIEDEPTVREMLVLNLRAEGFEVLETGDGVEGLNLARE